MKLNEAKKQYDKVINNKLKDGYINFQTSKVKLTLQKVMQGKKKHK